MKTKIFYFSGSGNSLRAARGLAEALGDAELVNIASVAPGELDLDADRIGLVFPCHMWGVPHFVKDFLPRVRTDRYVFAVVTHGGDMGGTIIQAQKILAKAGTTLSAGFGLHFPSSYTPLGTVKPHHIQEKLFAKANDRIREIAGLIAAGQKLSLEKGNWFTANVLTGLMNERLSKYIPPMGRNFWADDKCRACGRCVQVCPTGNVRLVDGKPVWEGNCTQCFACLQWCPYSAAQYKKSTVGKRRYHHPDVQPKDMLLR